MKLQTYAYLAVGLLLLAAPAGALIPDNITISASPVWLTAGGDNAATITVQVKNSTSPLEGVGVDFEVDSTYGSISPLHAVTGSDGKAMADFRPGTVAGTVKITATVSLEGPDEPLKKSIDLHIDHAAPHKVANLWYEPEVTAGGEVDITVRMVDRHGNVVDSRREDALGIPLQAENVNFMVGSPGGGAVFVGGTDKIVVPVDENGNATARLRVDTVAGENVVYIQPPKPIKGEYISITGTADGMPAGIICTPNPPGASVPANGKDKITLMYELLDAYGNPAGGKGLWVNASVEDPEKNRLIYSSSLGQVWVTYGPAESIGTVTINATVDNMSPIVSNTTVLEFTSTEPEDMLLSASPQSMPGRDVKGDSVSELRAKVMDVKGNPVEGETVAFKIISNTSAPYNQTVDQALKEMSATTDISGYAVVEFYPGAFTTDRKAPGWNATATGTATVQATWKNATRGVEVNRNIILTWKNYPYLSVETEVTRANVAVNSTDGISNTTDVTIRLKGDGYALQPDPIDVVLAIDRSGSMKGQRIADAKSAAQIFVSMMDPARDRIGLVSYSNGATLNQPLGKNYSKVTKAIKDLEASGYTATREALHIGIQEMVAKKSSDPDVVRAVILMSDGEYNYYGDPLARGTGSDSHIWTGTKTDTYTYFSGLGGSRRDGGGLRTNQNMSVYAKNNGVRLYMISFSNDITPENTTWKTMDTLAEITGGKHYHAPTGTDLARVYADIAGELKTEAGIDTAMTILENVEMSSDQVLGDSILIPAYEVFTYVHDATRSTYIHNQTQTDNPAEPKVLFDGTIDQLNDWKNNRKLSFNIGTIRLNQTWEATFRLAVNSSYRGGENNNINIFGDGAKVTFNNGEDATHADTLSLPDTFITIFPDLTNEGITSAFLDVEFTGQMLGPGPYVDLVPLSWATTYNGTQGVDLFLTCSRYEDMRSPATFFTQTLDCTKFSTEDNMTTNSTLMDVRGLPPGEYWVTVTASARDARTAEDTTSLWAHTTDSSCSHIRIE